MANDLITRLLLDSKGFDNNLQKSTKQIQNFQQITNKVQGGLGTLGAGFTKLVPQIALLTGGISAASAAFDGFSQSSQGFSDGIEEIKGSIDSLITSLSSNILNGSLDNFFSNLGNVVDKAKLSAQARDALASSEMHSKVMADYYKAEAMELKNLIIVEKDANKQQELYLKGQETLSKYVSSANTYKNRLQNVAVTNFEDALAKQTIDGFTFKGRAVTDEEWEKFLGVTEEDAAKMAETFTTNFNKYNEQLLSLERNKIAAADPRPYISMINALEGKIQTYIDQHPIEWAIFGATKSNTIEEALGFVRTTSLQVKGINRDIASTTKEFYEINSRLEKSTTKVAQNVKDIKGADFKANLDRYQISIGFDNNAKKILSELPDSISEKLKQPFDRFYNSMEANKQLYSRGLISDEQYQNNELKYLQDFQGGIYRLMEDAVLRQDKKVMEEVIVPVLQSLGSKIQTYEEAKSFTTKASKYSASVNSIQTSGFSNLGQAEAKLQGAENLLSSINAEMQGLAVGSAEWEIYNKMAIKMSANINAINAEVEAFKNLNNINKDLSQSLMATQSVLGSLGSTFSATGDEGAAAFFNVLSATIPLISAISALAVAEGAEKAASSSKNWIEAIAATVALTGTIVAAIQAGRSNTKYADGGIVQSGSYSGDHNLVRVNGGEMILNGSQQANLFRMLNEGRGETNNSLNGQVQFRISGRDLVGTLNNYNSKYGKL